MLFGLVVLLGHFVSEGWSVAEQWWVVDVGY